jgi:hypothetical protein
MHRYFQLEMDKVTSLALPELKPEEIDAYLNIAQDELIKTRYSDTNTRKEGFEETQKRTEDIKNVIAEAAITLNNIYYNAFYSDRDTYQIPFADLQTYAKPQNRIYWITLMENIKYVTIGSTCEGSSGVAPVVRRRINDYAKAYNDPFNKPTLQFPVSYFSTVLEIDVGGKLPNNIIAVYRNRYIFKPLRMKIDWINPANNVNCELSDHIHIEIVQLAVQKALEAVESVRIQSYQTPQINE